MSSSNIFVLSNIYAGHYFVHSQTNLYDDVTIVDNTLSLMSIFTSYNKQHFCFNIIIFS